MSDQIYEDMLRVFLFGAGDSRIRSRFAVARGGQPQHQDQAVPPNVQPIIEAAPARDRVAELVALAMRQGAEQRAAEQVERAARQYRRSLVVSDSTSNSGE